jgi:cytochrome c biogenesis protein CcmG, thiol:disulfide interchange protein DsbE
LSKGSQERRQWARWGLLVAAVASVALLLSAELERARETPESLLAHAFGAQLLDEPAPDIEVVGRDGKPLRLSDLRGKVVFVNFWATWCPPCLAEIPDLEKLSEKMRHVPFEIFAVSSDNSWDDIRARFPADKGLLMGLDVARKAAAVYGTDKLPETYVVDRDGRLRLRFINVQPWTDERIHRYLEWLATKG